MNNSWDEQITKQQAEQKKYNQLRARYLERYDSFKLQLIILQGAIVGAVLSLSKDSVNGTLIGLSLIFFIISIASGIASLYLSIMGGFWGTFQDEQWSNKSHESMLQLIDNQRFIEWKKILEKANLRMEDFSPKLRLMERFLRFTKLDADTFEILFYWSFIAGLVTIFAHSMVIPLE